MIALLIRTLGKRKHPKRADTKTCFSFIRNISICFSQRFHVATALLMAFDRLWKKIIRRQFYRQDVVFEYKFQAIYCDFTKALTLQFTLFLSFSLYIRSMVLRNRSSINNVQLFVLIEIIKNICVKKISGIQVLSFLSRESSFNFMLPGKICEVTGFVRVLEILERTWIQSIIFQDWKSLKMVAGRSWKTQVIRSSEMGKSSNWKK